MIAALVFARVQPPPFPDAKGPFPRPGASYGFSVTKDADLVIGTGSIRLRVSFRGRPGDLDMESAREPMPMKAWVGQLSRNDPSLTFRWNAKRWRSITFGGKITRESLTAALTADMKRRHLSRLLYLGVIIRAEQFDWTVPSRLAAERREPFVGQPGDLRIAVNVSGSNAATIAFWRPDGTEAGLLNKMSVPQVTIYAPR